MTRWPRSWRPRPASCCSTSGPSSLTPRAAERKAAGDKRSHDFLMAALAAERPDDAVLSEEGADNRSGSRRPGMDRRPAGRHPRVLRTRPRRLGRARRVVAGRRTGRRRGGPSGAGRHTGHARRRRASARAGHRASSCRAPGRRPSRSRCATRWAAHWSRWVRPEPKSRRWCRVSPTCTCTPAASTSGIPLRPSRSPARPGCTPRASTARRWIYNRADPLLPDLVVCRPELADAVLAVTR